MTEEERQQAIRFSDEDLEHAQANVDRLKGELGQLEAQSQEARNEAAVAVATAILRVQDELTGWEERLSAVKAERAALNP